MINRAILKATLLTFSLAGATACEKADAEPKPTLPPRPEKKSTPLPSRLADSSARPSAATRGVGLTGRTRAHRVSKLATTASGRVDKVTFEVGDFVKAGEIMVRLDAEQARLSLASAEAALATAKAQAEGAKRDRARLEKAAPRGAVTQADLDRAVTGHQMAQAQVAQAEAAVAMARKGVSDTVIRAPFSGIVLMRSADPGEWVNTMSNAVIAEVADVDPLEIALEAPEHLLGKISVGDEVTVRFSATDQEVTAKISRVVAAVNPSSHSFEVVAEVKNPEHRLAPGLFAEAKLAKETAE